MKNRFSLILIVSLISCSNAFGSWSDKVAWVFDKINTPTDTLLKLKKAPLLNHLFHKEGKLYEYARVPKTIITAVMAYFTWKNETVRNVAGKVAAPVKRAMGMDKKTTKRKREMLKKRAEDWKEEKA